MSIAIDHTGVPAADPWAAARFLSEILAEGEITPEGPDGEMAAYSPARRAMRKRPKRPGRRADG